MGNGDWGLGIGDWGLGPIPNPLIKIIILLLYKIFNNYHLFKFKFINFLPKYTINNVII